MNAVLIIAHAPLAQALRLGVLHVLPEAAEHVLAVDVLPEATPEHTQREAEDALKRLPVDAKGGVLLLTDMLGATPSNVAQRLAACMSAAGGLPCQLLAGANLPMALRAVSYRHEPLARMAELALQGGVQAIVPVTLSPAHPRTPA